MTEWNKAIHIAQRLLKQEADMLPSVMGNFGPTEHPDVSGLHRAIKLLDALLEKEQA